MILLALAVAWLAGTTLAALGFGVLWPVAMMGGFGVAGGLTLAGNRAAALLVVLCALLMVVSVLRYEASRPAEVPSC